MANKIVALVNLQYVSDGASNTISLDLLKDPYIAGAGGAQPNLQNWFASDKHASDPTGVAVITSPSDGSTASLSGHILSVSLATIVAAGSVITVQVYLTF